MEVNDFPKWVQKSHKDDHWGQKSNAWAKWEFQPKTGEVLKTTKEKSYI